MRLTSIRWMIVLILVMTSAVPAASAAAPPGPEVSARSAALLDADSGRLLYEKDARRRMPIASVTKIMTAIVAIEHGNLSEKVTVSSRAEGVEGSSIYLAGGRADPPRASVVRTDAPVRQRCGGGDRRTCGRIGGGLCLYDE